MLRTFDKCGPCRLWRDSMRALLKQGEPVNVTVGGSPDSLRGVLNR
ncbi:hypothetical protein [Pseudodesulfovibrio portus]|nr:hypothetical protein [Pseudodesulfovibrio portus]